MHILTTCSRVLQFSHRDIVRQVEWYTKHGQEYGVGVRTLSKLPDLLLLPYGDVVSSIATFQLHVEDVFPLERGLCQVLLGSALVLQLVVADAEVAMFRVSRLCGVLGSARAASVLRA